MCGRFALTVSPAVLARVFGLADQPDWRPRYNIAPSQQVAVVRLTAPGAGGERKGADGAEAVEGTGTAGDGGAGGGVGGIGSAGIESAGSADSAGQLVRVLDRLRWGLIPPWAKDAAEGARLINARSETAAVKPAFREAFRRRRCLIPADGFFEWRSRFGRRQPMFVRSRDGLPLALAGLWQDWRGPDGQKIGSCTILTTRANELIEPIHDRMPVIIDPEHFDDWLDCRQVRIEALEGMLTPCAAGRLIAYPVSERVNSPRQDDPSCIAEIQDDERSDGLLF